MISQRGKGKRSMKSNFHTLRFFYGLMACVVVSAAWLTGGCKSVYSPDRISQKDIEAESSLVFVRPNRYSVLGTRSLRDYCEIMYEKFSVNEAGQPVVSFGLRNRGGKHWWDRKGPRVVIAAKGVFYESAVTGATITSPPVYETNWQRLPMTRGETIHYKFVCPVEAKGYQVTLSDAF